jgi:hypothetical protein
MVAFPEPKATGFSCLAYKMLFLDDKEVKMGTGG